MRRNNRRAGQASGNFNVQASLDVRDIATMAQFLIARGEITNEKYGKIISWCFDLGLNYLRQKYSQELVEFEGIEDAIQALDLMGYSVDQFKAGGNRRLLQAASRQAVNLDFNDTEFKNYGVGTKIKNSRELDVPAMAGPKAMTQADMERTAKELYRHDGTILAGYEYLFVPVKEDHSTVITLVKENALSPEEQNWQNAKAMARLILDGTKRKDGPECKPFASLIDAALEEVIREMNAQRAEKDEMEKIRVRAALLAGPTAVVA